MPPQKEGTVGDSLCFWVMHIRVSLFVLVGQAAVPGRYFRDVVAAYLFSRRLPGRLPSTNCRAEFAAYPPVLAS